MAQPLVGGVRSGLRVLVTAGAGGIGRVMADTFVAHGARVMICDVDEAALDGWRKAHPGQPAIRADVASPADVDALFEAVAHELGGLDVLVNNAGIAGPTAAVEDIDPEEWRRTIDVNLNGQFHCLRRAVPLLKAAGSGSIINIASVAGRLGYAYRLPYAASKWAIVGMTESLSIELGRDGIRVNAILPGIVEGPRIDKVIGARAQELGIGFEEMRQRYLEKTALGRMVTPQDVANMAVFLCSSMGASISGQALSVCGHVTSL
ncbi:SDR family oxidoreductase [Geminicoccaceae bacterium 1502E]|nr:SDR family oxidoreductase [Geminicoccaceae bacterium 1502E]